MTRDDASTTLLSVKGLRVSLGNPAVEAVRGIDFSIHPGEIVGLAGESGSGKSVTALALTRLLPDKAAPSYGGKIILEGTPGNLLALSERSLRRVRGSQIGYVFQEPSASFNPVYTIGSHMREILRTRGIPSGRMKTEIEAALDAVGIPSDHAHLKAWPGDFSGGMLQRAAIACALLGHPGLLVADEPTTALDASTQKRIVELLKRVSRERNMAILFISHDLGVIRNIATRLVVMKDGFVVEAGPTREVMDNPRAPYTRRLLDSLPRLRL